MSNIPDWRFPVSIGFERFTPVMIFGKAERAFVSLAIIENSITDSKLNGVQNLVHLECIIITERYLSLNKMLCKNLNTSFFYYTERQLAIMDPTQAVTRLRSSCRTICTT